MSELFYVPNLPQHDKDFVFRGICPWCLARLNDASLIGKPHTDECSECGDEFISKLPTPPTIEGE